MEEKPKPIFTSAYRAFAYEWREEHREAISKLFYIEILRRIAEDWSKLTPSDKVIYWERAGVTKTISQPQKKKKVTLQKIDDEYEFSKPSKKKSRSFGNLSSVTTDDSSDSDTFIQQKRKYRKRDKNWKSSDSDSHGTYGKRKK